jgi:Uma2 family endonuclease
MSGARRRPDRWTLHEFQEMELNAPPNEKWELIDGIIWKMMTGGTLAHNEIVVNIVMALGNQIKSNGMPCRVYSENAKLVNDRNDVSTYPDIAVRCGPRELDQKEIRDPVLLVEVLSRSTAEKDRYDKAEAYFRIASVTHYLLVSQDRMDVTVLTRGEVDWSRKRYYAPVDRIVVDSLQLELTLAAIYEGVAEISG